MAANWLKARQTKYTAYVAIYIVVIVAVLAAVNFLANRYDKSYDSTANKQFSLSDQTIKVVKGLKHDVTLTYFDEPRSFPQARDLLDRYASLSPKLHVDYIDPGEEAAAGQGRRLPPRRHRSWWIAARARKRPRASPKKKSPAR